LLPAPYWLAVAGEKVNNGTDLQQNGTRRPGMSNHVYKTVELVGSSPKGIDAAIENAISRAAKTIRNLDWFEVKEVRGHIADNKIAHYQVKLAVGFRLEG